MKRSKAVLAGLCTLLLAGCSGAVTSVPDGSSKLFTVGSTTVTKNDEYELIKMASGPTLTLSAAKQLIYDEEIGVTDEIKEEAEETYESYASTSDSFEDTLKSYGYADKQAYIDDVLIPSLQSDALLEKYFEDAKDAIEEEYHPVLASIIQTDSEDNANKALEALKNGEDAAKVAAQYGESDATYTGAEQIITTQDTTLPTRLQNMLWETTETGVIDEVFSDDTSTDDVTYYVAVLVSKDYDENLDKIVDALSSVSQISTDCVVYYLKKYDFEVHDQYIFDYYKANNPEYLVTRPDLSED